MQLKLFQLRDISQSRRYEALGKDVISSADAATPNAAEAATADTVAVNAAAIAAAEAAAANAAAEAAEAAAAAGLHPPKPWNPAAPQSC